MTHVGNIWHLRLKLGEIEIEVNPAVIDRAAIEPSRQEIGDLLWSLEGGDAEIASTLLELYARIDGRSVFDGDAGSSLHGPHLPANVAVHEVRHRLDFAARSGELVVRRRHAEWASEVIPPPLLPAKTVTEVLSWIGLWLVDQDGKAVPGRPYRIVTSAGTTRSGVLDDQGAAHLTGLEPGPCDVYCPDVEPHGVMTYAVADGDHVSGIAQANGFDDYKTVWNSSPNAALRSTRTNPHELVAGDSLSIPALASRPVSKPTGADHVFTIIRSPMNVRVKVLGMTMKPSASLACKLNGVALSTDGSGIVAAPVDKLARTVTLSLDAGDLALTVGGLEPSAEATAGGWKARLFNMGFLIDPDAGDGDDELAFAIEDFQADQGLTVTGTIDDATQAALQTAHDGG
jgi:Putative peptidoglycan binding domain